MLLKNQNYLTPSNPKASGLMSINKCETTIKSEPSIKCESDIPKFKVNNVYKESGQVTSHSLPPPIKSNNNNLITALNTPIKLLSPKSQENLNSMLNPLNVVCNTNNQNNNLSNGQNQGKLNSPSSHNVKKCQSKNITPVQKYQPNKLPHEISQTPIENQQQTQSNQISLEKSKTKEVIDENLLPLESYLNDLLLPDTRIFASHLNKVPKDPTSQTNSNNSNNNKRVLTDFNCKSINFGNTEHVIIDNVDDLANFTGQFSKLKDYACAIADKLNKPVTFPAFLVIDQTSSVEKIKQLLAQNNISPIIVDNVSAQTTRPRNNKDTKSDDETNFVKQEPSAHQLPAQQNNYLIQSLNKDISSNSSNNNSHNNSNSNNTINSNNASNDNSNNSIVKVETKVSSTKGSAKKKTNTSNKRSKSKSTNEAATEMNIKTNQMNQSIDDQSLLQQQPPLPKKARKQKTIKDISKSQYLIEAQYAINSDIKPVIAHNPNPNGGLIDFASGINYSNIETNTTLCDSSKVINLSEPSMENFKFINDCSTTNQTSLLKQSDVSDSLINSKIKAETKCQNNFVNSNCDEELGNKANDLITLTNVNLNSDNDIVLLNDAECFSNGNANNVISQNANEFSDFNFDNFDSNVFDLNDLI